MQTSPHAMWISKNIVQSKKLEKTTKNWKQEDNESIELQSCRGRREGLKILLISGAEKFN